MYDNQIVGLLIQTIITVTIGFPNQILNIFSGVICAAALEYIFTGSKYTVNPFMWTDCKLTYFCWYFFNHYSSALLVC